MSLDKLDVKVATLGDHGEKLDSLLEAAKQQLWRVEGEKLGIQRVMEKIQGLGAHVDKDLEEGAFKEYGDDELKVAALIKKWILRSAGVAENLILNADAARFRAQGQIDGLAAAVNFTQREYDKHFGEKKSIEKMIEDGVEPEEAVRQKALSPAEDLRQRREEAAKEKAAKSGESNGSPKKPKKKPPTSRKKKPSRRGKNT